MNQHSAIGQDHRTRILDAAHRCFVRSGFHRATMQDVAHEAGMSAGNIYRYFASKDQIVSGLCERDRADLAGSFVSLRSAADPFALFEAIGRHHLVDEPREKAVFALDLWAEAARNPRLAAICNDVEQDIRNRITDFVVHLVDSGQAVAHLDAAALVELLLCMGDGLLARRAREPSFDPAPHVVHIGQVFRLACAGAFPSLVSAPAGVPLASGGD
ncbi:MAG: TetR/AcrR family transcriptional regulator [Hyphomicrobiales bacterium]|jgi:TetR/AcrR family transcriptional repressor of uid operon|nr:TetR/AcrR family transcriptional regulator [Hyphomicrobiales bacterium]